MQDLICLSAFPKSGVTYLGFLLFHCLFGDEEDIRELEKRYVIDIHAYPTLPFAGADKPRLFKSHYPCAAGQPGMGRTAKAVYLIRHPVDVMMSAWDYRQYLHPDGAEPRGTSGDHAFRRFVRNWLTTGGAEFDFAGTWLHHVRSWLGQREIPVHPVTYADLVDRPERELPAILEFLGLEVDADRQATAIRRSTMKAMAALEAEEARNRRDGVFYRQELARGYESGRRFVNKGYRDCYHTILTDEERALADRTFGRELSTWFDGQRGAGHTASSES